MKSALALHGFIGKHKNLSGYKVYHFQDRSGATLSGTKIAPRINVSCVNRRLKPDRKLSEHNLKYHSLSNPLTSGSIVSTKDSQSTLALNERLPLSHKKAGIKFLVENNYIRGYAVNLLSDLSAYIF
jgi:hypothetical protein